MPEIFAPDGVLAAQVPGFGKRPQQLAMAVAVAEAIEQDTALICEAGTGVGKTFAYLVPAILSERKVIISTGTRNLQDQLYHRDLPLVRSALGVPVRVALLKGRRNYLCRQRLDTQALELGRHSARVLEDWRRVRDWAASTEEGDIAELAIAEDAPVWSLVTATMDYCLGQECPHWDHCYVVAARRRAQESEILVINHHLLCADIALRKDNCGEILPGADCMIIDEAHQLPEIAATAFGQSLSSHQLLDLARDLTLDYQTEAGDYPELANAIDALQLATQEVRLSFGLNDRRGTWDEALNEPCICRTCQELRDAVERLNDALAAVAGRGKGLDRGRERGLALATRLFQLTADNQQNTQDQVRWFDVRGRSFYLHETPLDVAVGFQAHRSRWSIPWIFTSATLAVDDSFAHYASQLGLEQAQTARWDSPFDYATQALWYVPQGMPDPNTQSFTPAVANLAAELIALAKGRTFVLFTAHRALRAVAELLESRIDYPLLVQGEAPRAELIERFRQLGNAVLLGSTSFWEGVDVRGEALSCVIVDKLPFASPGDPLLRARLDALQRQGANPFRDYQLPRAVIALKQGAGRLIRDQHDRGLFVVCDPRLLRRPYGHAFLRSLPPMARTRELAQAREFLLTT